MLTLRTGFVLFHHLLTALGLSCLILANLVSVPVGLLLLGGLAVCFFLEMKKRIPVRPPGNFSFPKWAVLALPLLYLIGDLSLMDLVIWFLVSILFTRIIFKTELNDYLFENLVTITLLLIGAIFIQGLAFGLVFLMFYLILCWNLIFYNMMVERKGSSCPPSVFKYIGEKETPGLPLFALSTTLVLFSLILTSLIFISFPRLGLQFLSLDNAAGPISGFSETVRLGDVGKLKQNDSVVMRVEYTRDGKTYRPRSPVFWRGVVLDHYDGRNWSTTLPVESRIRNRPGVGVPVFTVRPARVVVEQQVFMESFDSNLIFTHGIPLRIDGNFRTAEIDQGFVVRIHGPPRSGPKKFTLVSEIGHPSLAYPLKTLRLPPRRFSQRYLQLPALNPSIFHLVRQLTGEAATPGEKANRILSHFRSGFRYTLEMPEGTRENALEHFLFHRKAGHCEYFASAMVVLLRAAGIPARLVNGFIGTEWNEWGDYMILRHKHAHSWVEAFLPDRGWTIYDPTPPDPAALENPSAHPLARTLDFLRMSWQRYIIRYSMQDQVEIMKYFSTGGRDLARRFHRLKTAEWSDVKSYLKTHAGGILLALALLGIFPLWKRYSRYGGGLGPGRPPFAVILYRDMLARLEKKGIDKRPHWTPRDLIPRLGALPEEKRALVEKITDFYEKTRFGNIPFKTGQKKEMLECLRRL